MTPLGIFLEPRIFAQKLVWSTPARAWLWPLKVQRIGRKVTIVRRELLKEKYDLIVDGFPRSGNSSIAAGLGIRHPELRIRTHCHQAIHVIQAVKHHRKRAVVLLRHPIGAIPSAARHQKWSLFGATARYCAYYESLLPYLSDVLVVDFSLVEQRVIDGIAEISSRSGLRSVNGANPVTIENLRDAVLRLPWGHQDSTSSWPSVSRELLTQSLVSQFEANSDLLNRSLRAWTAIRDRSLKAGTLIR